MIPWKELWLEWSLVSGTMGAHCTLITCHNIRCTRRVLCIRLNNRCTTMMVKTKVRRTKIHKAGIFWLLICLLNIIYYIYKNDYIALTVCCRSDLDLKSQLSLRLLKYRVEFYIYDPVACLYVFPVLYRLRVQLFLPITYDSFFLHIDLIINLQFLNSQQVVRMKMKNIYVVLKWMTC